MIEGFAPRLGIVLGSGLGGIADALENPTRFPYGELEGFPQPTVQGHGGTLHFGELGGTPVAIFQGRKHIYEGGDPGAMRVPIRTLKRSARMRCWSPTRPAACAPRSARAA